MMSARKKSRMAGRRAWTGRMFVLPFTLGFFLLFLYPALQSLRYSLSNVSFENGIFQVVWLGLDHYVIAFTKDAQFPVLLADAFRNMALQVPVILLFSMFIAMILNQRFRGRTAARAVFFLPVIVTSGIIISILNEDIFNQTIQMGNQQSTAIFQSTGLQQMMLGLKIPAGVITALTEVVNSIFDMLWHSGVQILIFLAAMQGVPGQLYEAARIEGATAWESYWKITFPIISPLLFTCLIYSVIDTFTDYSNALMLTIHQMAFQQLRYSYACAMAWVFFILVSLLIGLIYLLVGRHVYYSVD